MRTTKIMTLALASTLALAGSAVAQDEQALTQGQIVQTAFDTVSGLPDAPDGQITVQLRIRYQGDPLPGDGIRFHETVPETDGLFSMASLPEGQTPPQGDLIEDGIVFVEPGGRLKTELVFENPSDADSVFVAVPWYVDPAPLHLALTNQCFCASVPWVAPAGGSWYRTIYTDVDDWVAPGSKLAIVWTVVTDPTQFALLPGETVDSAVKAFNIFPASEPSGDGDGDAKTTVDVQLSIVGKDIMFDTDELVAPADTTFDIVFDNQDAGIPHNIAVYADPSVAELVAGTTIESGPLVQTLSFDGLAAGSYFYRCDVHPTTMSGTLEITA